jgi:hypothetical protein
VAVCIFPLKGTILDSPPTGERAGMRFSNSSLPTSATRTRAGRMPAPRMKFLAWCASAGVPSIGAVQPVHVATWIRPYRRDELSLDEVERTVI